MDSKYPSIWDSSEENSLVSMTELSALLKVLEFEYFAGRECFLGEAVF